MTTDLTCVEGEEGEGCVNDADVRQVLNASKTARQGYLQRYTQAERQAIKQQAEEMGYDKNAIDSAIQEV